MTTFFLRDISPLNCGHDTASIGGGALINGFSEIQHIQV